MLSNKHTSARLALWSNLGFVRKTSRHNKKEEGLTCRVGRCYTVDRFKIVNLYRVKIPRDVGTNIDWHKGIPYRLRAMIW